MPPPRALTLVAALLAAPAPAGVGWPSLEPPPASTRQDAPQDAALVIGIEDYAYAPDLPGARANAVAWASWLSARGVPFVKPLLNEQATREAMATAAAQAASQVRAGGRLWVIYIGHGAPGDDDGLLVGADAQQNPESLRARGLPRGELLRVAEAALPGDAELLLVQDACFSGRTASGDLVPGLAPLKVVAASLGPRATVLSSARSDQYAGPLPDGSRPAFSYLVLGALRGWGDADGDGVVSAAEAVGYAERALLQTVHGRTQTPTHEGPDLALGSSGAELGPDLRQLAWASSGQKAEASASPRAEPVGAQVDIAALAAAAAEAERAAAQALADAEEAAAALELERRRRMDAAAAEVRTAATRDFAALGEIVARPTVHGRPALQAWMEKYASAQVTVDGVSERVELPETPRVRDALAAASGSASRSASSEQPPAPGAAPVGGKPLTPEEAAQLQARAREAYLLLAHSFEGPSTPAQSMATMAFLLRFGRAGVLQDGATVPLEVPEVSLVRAQLAGEVVTATVPAGTYFLRCVDGPETCGEAEHPRAVTLQHDILMMQTEVTQGLWRRIMGTNPAQGTGCGDACPVEMISWREAIAFANELSRREGLPECYGPLAESSPYWSVPHASAGVVWRWGQACGGWRLPTEDEWEVAAHGGRLSPFAGASEADSVGWIQGNSGGRTRQVRLKEPNGFGLYDMTGNVWEWVWDMQVSSWGPPRHIAKGGAFGSSPSYARISARYLDAADSRSPDRGLRLVRGAP
jgi:sulfatase modifying factor 1